MSLPCALIALTTLLMTIVAMDEARRRELKASYRNLITAQSDHLLMVQRIMWWTHQGKHNVCDSVVSPHPSEPNEGGNQCQTGGRRSHAVEEKHDIGSSLHSVYAVLERRRPFQIFKTDTRLELILDSGRWVEVVERRLIGAKGYVPRGLRGQIAVRRRSEIALS